MNILKSLALGELGGISFDIFCQPADCMLQLWSSGFRVSTEFLPSPYRMLTACTLAFPDLGELGGISFDIFCPLALVRLM